jgi:hypothetical protein
MSVQRRQTKYGAFEFRRLRLVVRDGGRTIYDKQLCSESRCSIASRHTLGLPNVWGSAGPEVVLDTYTGGAHCCFESLIVLTDGGLAGRAISHFWGDPGYEIQKLGGAPAFVTADDRFAYEFTSYAASGLPVRVFAIGAHGVMNDITQTQLGLVKKDAAQFWHGYTSLRGKKDDDIRGVLAAWCADEYRLGQKAACDAELHRALVKGYLDTYDGFWPRGAKYIAFVHRRLAKWGYPANP